MPCGPLAAMPFGPRIRERARKDRGNPFHLRPFDPMTKASELDFHIWVTGVVNFVLTNWLRPTCTTENDAIITCMHIHQTCLLPPGCLVGRNARSSTYVTSNKWSSWPPRDGRDHERGYPIKSNKKGALAGNYQLVLRRVTPL